ncbi:MAG: DUF4296 domain-containing protein [Maribacter sp.]|nr:DUF4296 domain-containing protein [Maribacter sp.]
MKNLFVLLLVILLTSCGEKLLDKPENLIPKDKMIIILKDMTILNSARNLSVTALHENKIDPTTFVFSKYGIDSLQFVASDRYYASLPKEYEAMYKEIEKQLDEEKEQMSESKRIKDSLELKNKLMKSPIKRRKSTKTKDSLP